MSGADERVTAARQYLAIARVADPDRMPPSQLVAEVAETRRQLAAVLAVIEDQPPGLTGPQLTLVLGALDDAAAVAEERAGAVCADCAHTESGLCYRHAEDLDEADAYRQLAREIGGQR